MTFSLSGRPFQVEAVLETYGSPAGSGWQYDTYQGASLLLTYSYSSNSNATFRSIYGAAFAELSTYINVTFQQVGDQAELVTGTNFTNYAVNGADGNADLRLSQQSDTTRAGGWAGTWFWTNDADADMEDIDAVNQIWSINHYTIIHELGHAMSLKHTSPGSSPAEPPYLQSWEQNNNYTVMHYKMDGSQNITYAADGEWDYRHFQLYDVYALQLRFGTNNATYAGNTVHNVTSLGMDQWLRVLWDASGTDTIDMTSQSRNQRIDLRDGAFSDVGSIAGNNPTADNLAIAIGAQIENANGGSGADTITGNAVANVLNANGGNDTIVGSGGNDTIDGGAGTDLVQYSGVRAGYTVTAAGAVYSITKSGGGTDSVTNVENVQFSDGTFAIASLVGGGTGGGSGIPYPSTTNTYQAVGYSSGTAANDRVLTDSLSNAQFSTGDGDDYITLSNWNLLAYAGNGNDVIVARATSAHMSGEAGSDYFVFDMSGYATMPGWDTNMGQVADYVDGVDKIGFIYTTVANFAQLQPNIVQNGADVDITIEGRVLKILNVTVGSLTASDFVISAGDGTGSGGGTTITGTAGNDTLNGTAANETIIGLAGNDTMNGNDGDDNFQVSGTGDGFDVFNGGNGTDTVIATAANTVIGLAGASGIEAYSAGGFANVSIQTQGTDETFDFSSATLTGIANINAGAGNDTITGSVSADTIIGGLGNDALNGGNGDDVLDGGAGTNTLNGGAGTDTARYSAARATYTVVDNGNGTYGLTGNGSTDTLSAVESVQFSDGTFAIGSLVAPAPGTITVSTVAELRAAIHNSAYSTILVTAGTYTVMDHDPATTWGEVGMLIDRNLTIKSVGPGRADIYAGITLSKALFATAEGSSASVTFDGIGFFDTRGDGNQGSSENYSGIKFQSNSTATLTVLNSHFENNYNAIKSISGSGALFVDNTTFLHNGNLNGTGQEHQIYWEGTSTHFEDSYFSDSGYGHTIKSIVSGSTEIWRVTILDGPNAAPLIDVSGGGNLSIRDSNLSKDSTATNTNIIQYDPMRGTSVTGTIEIVNNVISSSYASPWAGELAVILRNWSDAVATISGNTFNGNFSANPIGGDAVYTNNTLNGTFANQSFNSNPIWRAQATDLTAGPDNYDIGTFGQGYNAWDFGLGHDGGDGDDVIVASQTGGARNYIFGGLGNDQIGGGDGGDTIFGDAGDDVLFSSSGYDDYLFGGIGADKLLVGPMESGLTANVWFDGGDGNDILDGRNATTTSMIGGAGNDLILGSAVATSDSFNSIWDGINAGSGDDIVYAGWGRENYIFGGAGVDTLVYAGSYLNDFSLVIEYGNIRISGLTQAGNNEVGGSVETPTDFEYIQFSDGVYYTATQTFVQNEVRVSLATLLATPTPSYPGAGNPPLTLTGTAAVDTLTGQGGDDIITGLAGDDSLVGNGGNDTFRYTTAAEGFDAVDGGAGTDTLVATANNAVIGLRSIAGVESISAGSFTGVYVLGSANADTLDFSGITMTGIGRIDGGAGNDVLTGTAAADIFRGSAGDDSMYGGDGNDTFQYTGTASGFDAVDGGAGTDTITALANNSVIGISSLTGVEAISAGAFTGVYVSGSATANTLDLTNVTLTNIVRVQGGDGNDVITGNTAANILWGGNNDDTLNGGAGNDSMLGDAGNDILIAGAGTDIITGGAGTDTVSYANYTVGVTVNLSLTTAQTVTAGDIDTITTVENVTGGSGNDTLTGTTAVNVILGGGGNDIIDSGNGADQLTGGAGADQFRRASGATGIDRIFDFTSGTDKIALQDSGWAQTATIALRQGAGAQTSNSTNSTFLYNSTTGALHFDVDGTGATAAVQIATLNTGQTLAVGDFIFY
jgi:Ca2+-binding RTX toxin-like protein